jgi:hypothetical protein
VIRINSLLMLVAASIGPQWACADVEPVDSEPARRIEPPAGFRVASESLFSHSDAAFFRYRDGRLLIIGDSRAELWNPRARAWEPIEMPAAWRNDRSRTRAVQLPNGDVLAMRDAEMGTGRSGALDAQVWDARRQRWATSFNLIVPRALHTATVRADGTVVIVGGGIPTSALLPYLLLARHRPIEATELLTGTDVQPGPPLGVARHSHAAVALANGEVLVIGGIGSRGEVLGSVERLGPSARRWSPAPDLITPRYDATVAVLGDGRVLAIGGRDQEMRPLASVEVLDPSTLRWRPAPSLPAPRAGAVSIALSNSDVLLVGGVDAGARAIEDALVFRSRGERWESGGPARLGRAPAAVALERNDALLVTPDRAVVYWRFGPQPAARTSRQLPPWRFPALLTLSDGNLLVAGGDSDQVKVWDPRHDAWSDRATLPAPLRKPRALALPDGQIVVVGVDPNDRLRCVFSTPMLDAWRSCPGFEAIATARLDQSRPTLDRLADGRVLTILGRSQGALFDADRGTWTPLTLRARVLDPGAQRDTGEFRGLRVVGSAPLYSLLAPPSDPGADGAATPLDATAYAVPAFYSDAGVRLADGRFLAVLHSQRRLALWDSSTSTWQLRRNQHIDESLGRTLLALPDGCVLAFADRDSLPRTFGTSRPRFAVIQPDTLSVSHLHGVFLDLREASFALVGGWVTAVGHGAMGDGVRHRFKASCNGIEALASRSLMPSGPGVPLRRLDPDEFLQPLTQSLPAVAGTGDDELSLRDPAVVLLVVGTMGSMVSLLLIPLLLPVAGVVIYRRLHRRKSPTG